MTNVAEKFARKRLTGNLRMFVWLVSLQLVSLVGSVVADDNCVEANELVQRAVQSAEGGRAELEVYDQALAKCPNMPEAHYNRGIVLLKLEQVAAAGEAFSSALSLRDDIQFRIALGNVRYREGRFAEAESEYRTVLKASQRNVEALNGLGLVLARTEQRDEAIGALERAQRISPLHPVTAYNLAVLYQGKGDNQEAIRQYKIAIEQGSHFEANLQLGMLMLHLARLDESEQYLSNAATLRSDDANVLRTMARLYDRMRDYDKAEQALRRALAIEEADSESWLNLGVVLINKRQEGVAEQALSKAIKLDPKNAQALTALGWAQIELGKYAEAEDSLKQALALDASNALARNNLGVLFERQGRLDDARLELERALKLDPDLELAQRNMERLK